MNNFNGQVWQKRFYDEGIRDTSMLMQKIEYIHNNPIRKNFVILAKDYPYSSYHHYFGNNENMIGIDEIDY
jgi:putative transposase